MSTPQPHAPAPRPPVAVLAWHGTRGAAGRADTARLTAAVADELAAASAGTGHPAPRVVAAFVDAEVQRPCLAEVLAAELADDTARVVVVPALLAAGYHVRTDIPAAVAACPDPARVQVTAHLGGDDGRPPVELVDAVAAVAVATGDDRAAGAAGAAGGAGRCILVSAGSSVASVEDELVLLAAAVSDRIGSPCAHEALAAARTDVTTRDRVVPLLLAEGYFAEQVRRLPGSCGPLLGAQPGAAHLVALLARRYRESATAQRGRP